MVCHRLVGRTFVPNDELDDCEVMAEYFECGLNQVDVRLRGEVGFFEEGSNRKKWSPQESRLKLYVD